MNIRYGLVVIGFVATTSGCDDDPTEAPSSNNLRAVAAPSPEAPPVTSATLPLLSIHPP